MPDPDSPPPRPCDNSYPLPRGRIFAGEYPFSIEPGRAGEKLRGFLDAGVTYFIDLTEEGELEPYEPLLREEAEARGVSVEYVRLSIRDMDVPAPERMLEILDAIDAAHAAGHTVYVHCWGGVGRTGTVVGCHLVRHGLGGEEALAEVTRLFRTMSPAKVAAMTWGSPQTEAQRAFVRRWREGEGEGEGQSEDAR